MLKTNVFPVQGDHHYTNDWGNARSGGRTHEGTDIFAAAGTPVVAVSDGKITAAGDDGGKGGLRIWVSGKFYYAHLSGLAKGLKVGMPVKAGQVIGYVGTSGNAKGGAPHLHFGYDPKGGQSAGRSWGNPFPLLERWKTGRAVIEQAPVAQNGTEPTSVQPADLSFSPGVPVGPPLAGVPGAELPGSSEIPFRPTGSAGDLWQLVGPQSQEGQRFLDLATGGER